MAIRWPSREVVWCVSIWQGPSLSTFRLSSVCHMPIKESVMAWPGWDLVRSVVNSLQCFGRLASSRSFGASDRIDRTPSNHTALSCHGCWDVCASVRAKAVPGDVSKVCAAKRLFRRFRSGSTSTIETKHTTPGRIVGWSRPVVLNGLFSRTGASFRSLA